MIAGPCEYAFDCELRHNPPTGLPVLNVSRQLPESCPRQHSYLTVERLW